MASGAFWKTIDSQKIIDTVLYGFPTKEFTQVGETDKYNFYFIVPDYSEYVDFLREKLGDELYGEFDALLQNAGPLKEQLSVKEPVRPVTAAGIGEQFTFETTDLDGNVVTSAALFAGHKVTMINIWATWCDPCKNELPELRSLPRNWPEKTARSSESAKIHPMTTLPPPRQKRSSRRQASPIQTLRRRMRCLR